MSLERQTEPSVVQLEHYATKNEVSQLEARLNKDIGGLSGDVKALRTEVRYLVGGIGVVLTLVSIALRFWPN